MNVSIYQAASAMNANMKWHEKIAENISAASVPGFKKTNFQFSAKEGGALPQTGSVVPETPTRFQLPLAQGTVDFTSGSLTKTEVTTNVALGTEGFFEVEMPNGGLAYTRDGEFQLSSDGVLVTKQGFSVMGQNGLIEVDLEAGPMEIATTGEISAGGEDTGQQMRAVTFPNPHDLVYMGGGLFTTPSPDVQPLDIEEPDFRQGYLEESNVSVMQEMIQMMQAVRAYEGNAKIIQVHDQRLGKTIDRLSQPL